MSYKLSIVKNKMMKRIINILILLCCIASLSSCGNSTEERSRVLKIYNWADYIDEDVLAEFPDWYKQQTGEDLRIIYQVFDINEIMLTKIERGHEDFDVVCPSEYIIERMLRKDLLLPIDRNFGHTPDYIPNVSPYIRHELNKTSQPERQTEDYAVPYMWGTAGILFNKKFITAEEADTWDILWDSKNRGKILMKDSYRDAYGTAIIYAHARELADSTVTVEQLMNDNSPQAIALAEQRLKEMKPNIAGWEADFGKEMMTKNKAWINFTWSGDAVWGIIVKGRNGEKYLFGNSRGLHLVLFEPDKKNYELYQADKSFGEKVCFKMKIINNNGEFRYEFYVSEDEEWYPVMDVGDGFEPEYAGIFIKTWEKCSVKVTVGMKVVRI